MGFVGFLATITGYDVINAWSRCKNFNFEKNEAYNNWVTQINGINDHCEGGIKGTSWEINSGQLQATRINALGRITETGETLYHAWKGYGSSSIRTNCTERYKTWDEADARWRCISSDIIDSCEAEVNQLTKNRTDLLHTCIQIMTIATIFLCFAKALQSLTERTSRVFNTFLWSSLGCLTCYHLKNINSTFNMSYISSSDIDIAVGLVGSSNTILLGSQAVHAFNRKNFLVSAALAVSSVASAALAYCTFSMPNRL